MLRQKEEAVVIDVGLFLAVLIAGVGVGYLAKPKRLPLLSLLASATFAASSLEGAPRDALFLIATLLLGVSIGGYMAKMEAIMNALVSRCR